MAEEPTDSSPAMQDVVVRPFYNDVEGVAFSTGFDITSAEEEERRRARAARFNAEPVNYEAATQGLTNEEFERRRARLERFAQDMEDEALEFPEPLSSLELAHLPEEEVQREVSNFDPTAARRWDTLHLFGSRMLKQNLSTEQVLTLFEAYGPISVEWISDYRCNVVFGDSFSAKRALYLESRVRTADTLALRNYLIGHQIAVEFAEEDIPFIVWRTFSPPKAENATFTRVRDFEEADDNAAIDAGVYGKRGTRKDDVLALHSDDPAYSLCLRVATVADIKDPPGARVLSLYYQRNKAYHEQLRRRRARVAAERAKQGLPAEEGPRVRVPVPVPAHEERPAETAKPPTAWAELEDVVPADEATVVRKGRGFKAGREGLFDLAAPRVQVVKRADLADEDRESRGYSSRDARDSREYRSSRSYHDRSRSRSRSRDRRDRDYHRDARGRGHREREREHRDRRSDRSDRSRGERRPAERRVPLQRTSAVSVATERPRVRMDVPMPAGDMSDAGTNARYADMEVEAVGLTAMFARYRDEIEEDLERREREQEAKRNGEAMAAHEATVANEDAVPAEPVGESAHE